MKSECKCDCKKKVLAMIKELERMTFDRIEMTKARYIEELQGYIK